MSIVIIPLAIFLCVTAAVAAVAFQLAGSGKTEVEDRLAVLTGASSGKQAKESPLKGSVLAQPLGTTPSMLWTYLSRWGNLSLLFEQADTALTPRQFLGVCGILALVGDVRSGNGRTASQYRAADGHHAGVFAADMAF